MTTRRRQLLRALAAAGATAGAAGCLRLSDAGTATDVTSTTVTERASTTPPTTATTSGEADDDESTTTEAASFPPSVSEDGTSAALAAVHERVLWRTSYELSFRLVDVNDGRVHSAWRTRQADGVATQEMLDGSRLAVFYGDDHPYWRQDVGDGYTYGRSRDAAKPRETILTESYWVERFLRAGDWATGTLEDDGTATVTASSAKSPTSLEPRFPLDDLRSFEGECRVRQDGTVASLDVTFSFTSELEDGVQERRVRLETTNLGGVSAARPDWYATARERAPTASVSVTDDASAVALEQTGGNPILPGTWVVLYDREKRRNAAFVKLAEPLATGDTVYVWFGEDGPRLSRDRPTADAVARPVEGEYDLWCLRSAVEYFGVIDVPTPRVVPSDDATLDDATSVLPDDESRLSEQ